ncbi:MAG: aminoacyl-tRNA deacylase [Planctomycetota bacterium]|jgi:Ala-tRNA(Pro) deacylase
MGVREYLDERGVNYTVSEHQPSFTAQQVAAAEHEPGQYVAKPVIMKVDEKWVMCVLPACCKIDMHSLKQQLGAEQLELAEEKDIAKIFVDCELGAEPPFGNLYEMVTVMDKSLQKDDHIVFQGGNHHEAIHMSMEDYIELVEPKVLDFSYHLG